MAGDARAQQAHAIAREIEQQACSVVADQRLQRLLLAAVADDGLATVAPGRTPAYAPGFQHDDGVTGLGQRQRGGQAGIATAEDADIGMFGAFQPRLPGQGRRAARVQAVRVVAVRWIAARLGRVRASHHTVRRYRA